MSSLTLFCLSAVAHGVCADYCIHLLAYIRADEFKCCCGVHRVWSQHKDKLAVSNCCTVMNAYPPCTERHLHRWIPFSLADSSRDWCVSHYVHHIRYVSLTPRWNILPFPQSVDRFLPSPFFCSRLIYLQLHSPALTLPTPGGCSGVWSVHGSIFKWLFQITSKQIDCVLAFVIVCMISIVYALCCSNVFCQVFNREAVGGFSCVNLDTIAEHLTLHDPPHIKFNKDGLLCWNHK